MADNNNASKIIGGRFNLVDPNKFKNQSATGLFGDPNYNISVPNEDLSIMVELVTQTKNRTILKTEQKINTVSSTDNDKINVSFIDGSKNQSTGGENFLTTSYTDMFTEMKDVEEAFGITSIDIDFNSSYAPMVNINFIDIKGAGLFQMGAKSKYSVLFRLPYPLFELTVKGFYGKPVKYCLHMLKCNTKFNSSTGNFEIAAQFVGYSYAMLSDMLVGYMKAAALTPAGESLLKARGIISIKEYMKKIGAINGDLPEAVLSSSDADVNNLSTIEDIKKDLDSMRNLIYDAINSINIGRDAVIKVPDINEKGVSLNRTIAIVKDPKPESSNFDDKDNQTIGQNYDTKILEKVTEYNKKVEGIQDLKIGDTNLMTNSIVTSFYSNIENQTDVLKDEIKRSYAIQDDSRVTEIANRLKKASTEATRETNLIKFYDLTDALLEVNDKDKNLRIKQDELTKIVGEKLKTYITEQLGFDTSIRSIVRLFTVHIEIFLEQLFDVSSKYRTDTARAEELKRFQNEDSAKQIDVNGKDATKGIIYPWPEYFEDGVEKYLGSKKGPLNDPLNVPEIKFVEELYEAMKRQRDAENEDNNLEAATTVPGWLSINPVDSWYFNKDQTNPYGRLPDSANHDDFARLAVLRAVGYMGFSNKFLGDEEIKAFAKQEAALIVDKLKDDTDGKIIRALNLNYDTPDKYGNIEGKITDVFPTITTRRIFKNRDATNTDYKYSYIFSNNTGEDRLVLPVSQDFTDAAYNLENEFTHGFTLSNAITNEYVNNGQIEDKVDYIHILTKEEYEGYSLTLPITQTPRTFDVEGLKKDMTNYADLDAAGFSANNGKYGVQEFLKIDHVDTKDAPFFTLFYNKGNENVKVFETYVSPTLSRPREASATTQFDIGNTIQLPTTVKVEDGYGMERINEIYNKRKDIYENVFLAKEYTNTKSNVSCPFFNFTVSYRPTILATFGRVMNINLFGSRFYNAQTLEGKAFLFLHCFPWRGLTGFEKGKDGGPFGIKEIINVFINRTGFIQVPKYFLAFLGGIIQRYKNNSGLVKFSIGEGDDTEQLIPTFTNIDAGNEIPKPDEFLVRNDGATVGPMTFASFFVAEKAFSDDTGYAKIPEVLKNLPKPLQDKLIKEFNDFVKEYDTMRTSFEIRPKGYTGDGDDVSWKKAFNEISSNAVLSSDKLKATINLDIIVTNLTLANVKTFNETFNVFSFIPEQRGYENAGKWYDVFKYNYIIEYKDGSDPETKLREAITSYKYLSNESIFVWEPPKEIFTTIAGVNTSIGFSKIPFKNPISISQVNFNAYFEEFKTLVSNTVSQIQETKKFLTTDQEEIKFEIYRNLKKIYDKWIAFSDTKDRIIFQCCARGTNTPERLSTDAKLSKRRGTELELIDSFRFVDSFFRDIGDDFNINPFTVNQMLHETTNTNFYSFLSRILTDNNFDFVALPTFVDYNNPQEVLNIFKPYPYYEAKKLVAPSGPSFVCVYVGQTSTKLDFGEDQSSQYPNDGFDLTNDCLNCPKGITGNAKDADGKNEWEDVASAFVVRYGQQNQNFFKDVSLDQAEFGATAESLEITDALSNTLSDSNKSFYGQNLYDVYSVRSYKVEVEMMGDAMIQPMMYFQLDNMPMFHGAYLITHVKHSIKPHYMSTVFNGTRIKSVQTPLIDAASLYGALLGTFTLPSSTGALSNTTTGSYPPIVATILGNGGQNGNIKQGNITMKKVPKIDGVQNQKFSDTNDRDSMLTEATDALEVMLKDFVATAKTLNYPTLNKDGKTYISITSLFRDIAKQTELYDDMIKNKGRDDGSAAKIGRSNHGWGIAVDLQFISKSNSSIDNSTENAAVGFDVNQNESLKWFLDNGYKYGFIIPWGLRNGSGVEEFWHFEYHGTSAKCLYQLHPKVKSYEPTIDGNYNTIVINPLDSTNNRAVYTNCDFVTISTGDGTETKSTITTGELADNQVYVKNYLKNTLGYSKEATAGVMGNIQEESGFNPTVTPFDDLTGFKSWGLMQWNGPQYNNYALIGKTVQSQMDFYGTKWGDFGIPLFTAKMAEPNITAYMAAYYFAKHVERCANCTKGLDIYNSPSSQYSPYERSKSANDFFKRFNNPADRLYWEGDGTQAAANTAAAAASAGKTITIGDSISIGLQGAYPNQIKLGNSEPQAPLLNVIGINSTGFLTNLNLSTTDVGVKNVILSMGSNDGWQSTNGLKDSMIAKIKSLYPNAKYYILNGSYGWAGLTLSTASAVNNYISYYSARGFEVIGTVNFLAVHPAKGDALFNSFATSLKAKGLI